MLVLLYGCEAKSLTLREECRLRIFENRILRRIFGPKRDENSPAIKGKPAGKRHLGRTMLEWTLKRYVSMRGIGLIRLRLGIIGEPL